MKRFEFKKFIELKLKFIAFIYKYKQELKSFELLIIKRVTDIFK